MQPLNQRITEARKALGLTQEQVAEAMNVSRQTVSHWENGRVQPDNVTAKQLFALLKIQESETKQPKKRGTWKLAAAFLCGVLATLAVIYGCLPLLLQNRGGSKPSELMNTPSVLAQNGIVPYSWEWFQQADANEPDKAFIQFAPLESPVLLMEDRSFEAQYVWKIRFTIQETNGIPFTVEKFTQVYFNQEKRIMDSYELIGDECIRYWANLTFEGNSTQGYNTNRMVGGDIGYGAALEGKDANGNELTFKVYIPLSQEMKRPVTLEQFTKDHVQEDGKAYLNIYALESPVPQVYDTAFEGDWGWKYQYFVENVTDIPFTVELITEVYFRGETAAIVNTYDKDWLAQWDISNTFASGTPPYGSGGGANTMQCFTGLGIMVEGVDANGNELTFVHFIPFAQEKPQQ